MKPRPGAGCGSCCTRLENFGVRLGGAVILQDLNLHLHCGELTAIIGPNGAGKTTLLRALLGEIPFTGTVRFLDAGLGGLRAPRFGYVPQRLEFDAGAPVSVLDLGAALLSRAPVWLGVPRAVRDRVAAALARTEAEHLLARRFGDLSGGERQRVLLALACEPRPDLLLLDEPEAGIDAHGLEQFYATVCSLRHDFDLSIIIVSHTLELLARHADRFILLNRTLLAEGAPDAVLAHPACVALFGRFVPDPERRHPHRAESAAARHA